MWSKLAASRGSRACTLRSWQPVQRLSYSAEPSEPPSAACAADQPKPAIAAAATTTRRVAGFIHFSRDTVIGGCQITRESRGPGRKRAASATGAPLRRILDQRSADVLDRVRRAEPFRAHLGAVHDRAAAVQAVDVVEIGEPLAARGVAAVGDESPRLQQAGRPDELVGIPP